MAILNQPLALSDEHVPPLTDDMPPCHHGGPKELGGRHCFNLYYRLGEELHFVSELGTTLVSQGWVDSNPELTGSCVTTSSGAALAMSKDALYCVRGKDVTLCGQGYDASCMAPSSADGAFIISRGNLYHVNPGREVVDHWSSDWGDKCHMARSTDNGVYIVCGGILRLVTEGVKKGAHWSKERHNCVKAMCDDGFGGIFLISGTTLYQAWEGEQDPSKYSGGWYAAQMMTHDGACGAWIVVRGQLYHVSRWQKERDVNGNLWSCGWDPSWMSHCPNGGVYILSRGVLYRVSIGARCGEIVHKLGPNRGLSSDLQPNLRKLAAS